MPNELSPTAKALRALEAIQNVPGITAQVLGDRLGVTERAARRYVAILREADLPIDSVSGPYGGYRVGRGLRLPPLMFTAAEAMGLVMAVLEGHRDAADPADLVGSALAKIVRVLPAGVARPVLAFREVSAPRRGQDARVNPEVVTQLLAACTTEHRLRLQYRLAAGKTRQMEVDPWAVVLRHSYWYLLGWSHTSRAQRVLRIDRVLGVDVLTETFAPPQELDALRTLEEHLSRGWAYQVEVLVDAPIDQTRRFVRRSLGRLEPEDDGRTRLHATTSEPEWYARQLALIPWPFRIIESPELRQAMAAVSKQLADAAELTAAQ